MVLFEDEGVDVLLIPSLDWKNKKHPFLISRDYKGKKSKPEWGLQIGKRNIEAIKQLYSFERQVKLLK